MTEFSEVALGPAEYPDGRYDQDHSEHELKRRGRDHSDEEASEHGSYHGPHSHRRDSLGKVGAIRECVERAVPVYSLRHGLDADKKTRRTASLLICLQPEHERGDDEL